MKVIAACYGRNVWGHENPAGMARALRRVIHQDASIDMAMKELG